MKKLKQGQTIYIARVDTIQFPQPEVIFQSFFMYSQNEPLPSEGYMVLKMPVTHMRYIIKNFPYDFYTHSRRKAISRLKQLRLQYEK